MVVRWPAPAAVGPVTAVMTRSGRWTAIVTVATRTLLVSSSSRTASPSSATAARWHVHSTASAGIVTVVDADDVAFASSASTVREPRRRAWLRSNTGAGSRYSPTVNAPAAPA